MANLCMSAHIVGKGSMGRTVYQSMFTSFIHLNNPVNNFRHERHNSDAE